MPRGKPWTELVARCPMKITAAPSAGPKSIAERKPGNESKATVDTGLGICINEPTTARLAKRPILASVRVLTRRFVAHYLF